MVCFYLVTKGWIFYISLRENSFDINQSTFFVFVSSFFWRCCFSEYFCIIAVFSLYGEYVVRSFLPNGVFLPCDHGLDF